jgi:hypothetical protein
MPQRTIHLGFDVDKAAPVDVIDATKDRWIGADAMRDNLSSNTDPARALAWAYIANGAS